jgi:hypothetical protein
MLGCRTPPSDAQTRRWIIDKLSRNKRLTTRADLPVYTVLGSNTAHPDSSRLKGLFDMVAGAKLIQLPLFAEDLMDVFERDSLIESERKPRLPAP